MLPIDEPESGFIGREESDCYLGAAMRDVEIISETASGVIATGRRFGRRWFIKALRPELADASCMRRRLSKEFEIHSRLRHPGLSQAAALEEIDGLGLSIVQEWVEGTNLHEALRQGSLTPSQRRRVLRELTGIVAYLHSCGVVHRDIKPSNVMLRSAGGEVVLVDFGLADTDDYVEIKQPGGTPGFISPEQISSGGANPADDIYSLGVVMRELCPRYSVLARRCTGPLRRRPKDGGALLKLLQRRARRPRLISIALIAAAIVLMGALALWRITMLENDSQYSGQRLTDLAAKNARNEALVTTLHDSLTTVHTRLDSAQTKLNSTQTELNKISDYEQLKRASLTTGYEQIDRRLQQSDRETFSKFSNGDGERYVAALVELGKTQPKAIEQYCASIAKAGLTPEDLEKLRTDLYNYQSLRLSEYQARWTKKIYPDWQ